MVADPARGFGASKETTGALAAGGRTIIRRVIRRVTLMGAIRSAVVLFPLVVGVVAAANAGPNANTTLILHAVAVDSAALPSCVIDDPCLPEPGNPAVKIVKPGMLHAIYVLARNHQHLCGVLWALDWPAQWQFQFALWTCQEGQLYGWPPMPQGPGPWNGSVASAFNCVTSPATAVLGFMFMVPATGCLEIIESAFPGGTHALGPAMETDPIGSDRRGRVCVGPGGLNTCVPPASPVEGVTWGRIKASYQ